MITANTIRNTFFSADCEFRKWLANDRQYWVWFFKFYLLTMSAHLSYWYFYCGFTDPHTGQNSIMPYLVQLIPMMAIINLLPAFIFRLWIKRSARNCGWSLEGEECTQEETDCDLTEETVSRLESPKNLMYESKRNVQKWLETSALEPGEMEVLEDMLDIAELKAQLEELARDREYGVRPIKAKRVKADTKMTTEISQLAAEVGSWEAWKDCSKLEDRIYVKQLERAEELSSNAMCMD
ncbi:hypothetical protein BT63DRAFT_153160 [Microthyrium microscopicum]|uniref:Uncharacterized protein n=1 Tax=Microthyrium microscopicum TaxID=703497 RepID=A0A6A6UNM6_9PEZI|nr:hypothetical protein BT63DRAFT_153160 [Microthyrium microscopicum]